MAEKRCLRGVAFEPKSGRTASGFAYALLVLTGDVLNHRQTYFYLINALTNLKHFAS